MIASFSPPRGYDAHRVPVASNAQIASYAESVLGQYRPELIREAGTVDGLHFLEYFLGLSVEFQEIYTGRKPRILGATAFSESVLPVVDRSDGAPFVRLLKVQDGTVILDERPAWAEEKNRYSELFTQLHEAGHWLLHGFHYRSLALSSRTSGSGIPPAAEKLSGSVSPAQPPASGILPAVGNLSSSASSSAAAGSSSASAVSATSTDPFQIPAQLLQQPFPCACRAADIYGGSRRTESEKPAYLRMLEHQANVFASHLAMPDGTVIPLAKEQIFNLGYKEGVLEHQSSPEFDDEDLENLRQLLAMMKKTYGVSEKTAEIRLRELGLVRSVEFLDLWEKRNYADKNLHP